MRSFVCPRVSLLTLAIVMGQTILCFAAQPMAGAPFAAYQGVNPGAPFKAPSFEPRLAFAITMPLGNHREKADNAKPAFAAASNFVANEQIAQLKTAGDVAGQQGANLVPRHCNLNSFDPKVASLEIRVSYAFCLILGRLPDATGLQFWMANLKRPTPVSAMLQEMAASDEFRTLNRLDTLSNQDFIAMLYRRFLLREPDGGGAAAYNAELASGRADRRALIKGFVESHEFAVRHPILSAPLQ